MLALWNQVDDLLNDQLLHARRGRPSFSPAVDIVETKSGYRLTADLPGFGPDDVEITVESGSLVLSGERKWEADQTKDGFRHVERSYGQFRRTFSLPKGVDLEKIQASVENGVLTLDVPKPVAEIPRKIKVGTAAPAQLNS